MDQLARMRQLIGTTAEWAANDLVIGAGEIALETAGAGKPPRFKVGDGTKKYSELPFYTDSEVHLGDGTVSAPALAFASETGTGLYRPSAGVLGFSVLGVQRLSLAAGGATVTGGIAATGTITAGLFNAPVIAAVAPDGSSPVFRLNQSGVSFWEIFSPAGNPSLVFSDMRVSAERMRIDANGDVGIGAQTTGFAGIGRTLTLNGAGSSMLQLLADGADSAHLSASATKVSLTAVGARVLGFDTNGLERMSINAAGRVSVNESAPQGMFSVTANSQTVAVPGAFTDLRADAVGSSCVYFFRVAALVGQISTTQTATTYATSSDYRLKNISGDLQSSGAFIDALRPRVGTWRSDGSPFVGFVAHELQEVAPGAVCGEKDAVDADGNPQLQAVAYGSAEIITNIVAELQSLRQRLSALGG